MALLEKNPDIFLVASNIELWDEQKKTITEIKQQEPYIQIGDELLFNNQFTISSVMCRNENVKFDETLFFCEDYDLYLHLYTNGAKMVKMWDILCTYKIPNYSNEILEKHALTRARILRKYNKRLIPYFEFHKYMVWYYLQRKDYTSFIKQCLKFGIGDFPTWK